MPAALNIAPEIAGAGAALAGLLLVFLGATSTSFDGYEPQEKKAVRARYQRRAWIAFAGFVFALISSTCALIAKWLQTECLAATAAIVLGISLILVLLAALNAVLEIR